MTNEQLVVMIQNHRNEAESMLELWEQNKKLITMLSKYFLKYERFEDLQQIGYIGLCDAVRHYDAGEGVLFTTYAGWWIKQAMQRHIENNSAIVRVPARFMYKVRKREKMIVDYNKRYGRDPRRDEMRAFLNVGEETLTTIEKAARFSIMTSIDAPINDAEGLTMEEKLVDPCNVEEEALDKVQQEELQETIWPLVDSLPGQQSAYVRRFYQNKETYEQIAQAEGTTKKHVNSGLCMAMQKLRRPENKAILKPFLDDLAEAIAYKGSAGQFRKTWTSSTEKAAFKHMGV